jgi:hypothetical protein
MPSHPRKGWDISCGTWNFSSCSLAAGGDWREGKTLKAVLRQKIHPEYDTPAVAYKQGGW